MRRSQCGRWTLPFVLIVATFPALASAQDATPPPAPAQQQAADFCDGQEFSTLFRCTWQDIRHMARRQSLIWVVTGVGLAGGSVLLDDEVSHSMLDDEPDALFAAGEGLGHAGLHFGVPAALYLGARATGHPGAAAFAVTLLRTQVVNAALTRALKLAPRARPYQRDATFSRGSFPSGHTSAAFATATLIHRKWGWKRALPAYLIGAYVGTSRLQNFHYLSDVTFGAALGIASGLAVSLPASRASVSPVIGRGVTGVAVTISGDGRR